MTTRTQQRSTPRWVLVFLAALVAALAAILSGTTASASAAVGAETRVGAISFVGEVPVGPPQHITAGQRLGNSIAGADFVVATGVAANAVDDGVSLSLRYKPGWNSAQRSAADAKVAALNDAAGAGALRVTPVQRAGTSASSRYRSAGGTVPRGADVDHTIDLQLGGLDDIANMSPLDMSVNRSLGSQIMWQLRGVEPGTCVISVMIC